MSHYSGFDGSRSTGAAQSVPEERGSVARARGAVGAPLGTIARFHSIASQCAPPDCSPQVRRYALQAAARDLLPGERVSICLRRVIPGRQLVDVLYSPLVKAAHFGGLQVCGSVWHCPVCSSKITERRRVELSAGLMAWPGRSVLCTFTLRHNASEPLPVVLGGLLNAYEGLRTGRWWPAFSEQYGIVGSIRALEVTYGQSGWHPHLHVLMLLRQDLAIIPFEDGLKERWRKVLARSGRYASWASGVDVRFSDADIADYVAKFGRHSEWTVAHEVAKAPVKAGRSGGRSPLQLLADFVSGDELSGALWRDYALIFKGRKQLVWSRGLRALLGLVEAEKTDEELAAEQDEIAVLLAQLTRQQWAIVLANDARGELQEVAGSGDVEQVKCFLARLIGGTYN